MAFQILSFAITANDRHRQSLIGAGCGVAVIAIPIADVLIPGYDVLLPLNVIPVLIGARVLRLRGTVILTSTAALAQVGKGLFDRRPIVAIVAAVVTVLSVAVFGRIGYGRGDQQSVNESQANGSRARSRLNGLSRREQEIVLLTLDGWAGPRIADSLFISKRTVETHLGKAYQKLGVASKLELVSRRAEFIG